jgi:Lon protease-like protein
MKSAPVFPLPNVVFFPDTFLPLHVFEPRYRGMVEDALAGERLIAIVLAREVRPPGEPPAMHPIGSLGRVEIVETLEDGRFMILLRGLARVVFGRLEERPARYWRAEVEILPEMIPDLQDPLVAREKADFLLTARRYGELVLGGRYAADLLNDTIPYPTLVNRSAGLLRVSVDQRQRLLSLDDVGERAGLASAWMNDQIDASLAIEGFSDRRPRDSRLN